MDMEGSSLVDESSQKIKKRKISFVIEDVIMKDIEKIEPCLVNFSNGTLKHNGHVQGELYRNTSEMFIKRRKERILNISGGFLNYEGKNFGPDVHNPYKEHLFIGVLNKKTNKMKLHEASSFVVHPVIENRPSGKKDSLPQEGSSTSTSISSKEKKSELFSNFGGRKGRSIARKLTEKVNINDMQGALSEAIHIIDKNLEEEDSTPTEIVSSLLPPCNTETEDVSEVYKMGDIVSDEVLMYLNDEAMHYISLSKVEGAEQSSKSPLFWLILANSKFVESEPERARWVCAGLYLDYLIDFFKSGRKFAPKFGKGCLKPVQTDILAKFTGGKLRRLTQELADKVCVHVIILALILLRCEVPTAVLCQSLAITKRMLITLCSVLGAFHNSSKDLVVLKAPLNIQERVPVKARRRKK